MEEEPCKAPTLLDVLPLVMRNDRGRAPRTKKLRLRRPPQSQVRWQPQPLRRAPVPLPSDKAPPPPVYKLDDEEFSSKQEFIFEKGKPRAPSWASLRLASRAARAAHDAQVVALHVFEYEFYKEEKKEVEEKAEGNEAETEPGSITEAFLARLEAALSGGGAGVPALPAFPSLRRLWITDARIDVRQAAAIAGAARLWPRLERLELQRVEVAPEAATSWQSDPPAWCKNFWAQLTTIPAARSAGLPAVLAEALPVRAGPGAYVYIKPGTPIAPSEAEPPLLAALSTWAQVQTFELSRFIDCSFVNEEDRDENGVARPKQFFVARLDAGEGLLMCRAGAGGSAGGGALEALLAAPGARAAARRVKLRGADSPGAWTARTLAAADLPALRSLALVYTTLDHAAAVALRGAGWAASLESLELCGYFGFAAEGGGPDGLVALLAGGRWRALRSLRVAGALTPAVAEAVVFAGPAWAPRLRELSATIVGIRPQSEGPFGHGLRPLEGAADAAMPVLQAAAEARWPKCACSLAWAGRLFRHEARAVEYVGGTLDVDLPLEQEVLPPWMRDPTMDMVRMLMGGEAGWQEGGAPRGVRPHVSASFFP